MIATPNLGEIIGAEVVDPNNDTVGKVGRIYLDSERDVPTWVSVKTGLFGLAETLVPVDDATWEGNVLHVGVDKARIKDAPRVDVDQEIASEDQERLYSYYDRDVADGDAERGASGDYGSTTSGHGGSGEHGRHADRGEYGESTADAVGAGAAGAGAAGMSAAGTGGTRSNTGNEPLGGGNQNPAAFEGDEDQRLRDAGRSAGDGQLGGGAQNPDGMDGGANRSDDAGALGGGAQDPDRFDRGENRSSDEGNLGGGSQNPGGFSGLAGHSGVGASTHGGPGEFSGPGAGLADASRRAAEQDDPGRMRMTEGDAGDQGGMRRSDASTDTGQGDAAMGASGAQGTSSQGGGKMRLRRYVVTEQQTVTMPVTREEYRLEPEDGEGRDAGR